MDRYVIKGRGPNRGKYLCWGRMAPTEKATEDGFVWLPEQRKAVRWKNPKYSGHTWATDRARLHNGYFVELTVRGVTAAQVDALRAFIRDHAAGADEKLACYWISGANETFPGPLGFDPSADFCLDCCDEKVAEVHAKYRRRAEDVELSRDGGFDTEHDSPPSCATCGARLSGNLTEHGADQELEALTGDCAPAFNEPNGWDQLDDAICNLATMDPWWRKIARVVADAQKAEAAAEEAAKALAATPGMADARGDFLALLGARQEQKTPDPSYLLWNELNAYLALDYDTQRRDPDKATRTIERRLIREAERFAKCLGYACRWGGGSFTIEAPYGGYIWHFVVRAEQYRLWSPPEFQEGRAYGMHPCPSGDLTWPHHRDANPYKDGDERAAIWDGGYILGCHERATAEKAKAA